MRDHISEKQKRALLELSLLFLFLLAGDLWLDIASGTRRSHLILEIFAAVMGAGVTFTIWRRRVAPIVEALISSERGRSHLQERIETWKTSLAAYSQDVQKAIDKQFEIWNLTGAENETAFLLLKGLSIKEVAEVRQVSEKTVRQQCLGIYRKAGVKGRAELSAFFLEDILSGVPAASSDRRVG